jgi:hypothetical protein
MNAIVNLKQIHEQTMSDSVLPEWSEILERQQALETPVWVEEWLAAAHVSTRLAAETTEVETWLEIAARQQPLDTPIWQTEWLDWSDNRSVVKPASAAKPVHTVCTFYSAKNPVKDRSSTTRPNKQLAGMAA